MKKYLAISILILGFLSLLWMIFQIQQKVKIKQKAREEMQKIPSFRFGKVSNGYFSNTQLPDNKPVIIIYYNSDCGFCKSELQSIYSNLNKLNQIEILLISSEKVSILKNVAEQFDLTKATNIHFLYTDANIFYKTFGTNAIPSIFIYNRQKQLVKQFKGEIKIETIIKYANL